MHAMKRSTCESVIFQEVLGAHCQYVMFSLFICKECDVSLQKEQLKLLWRGLLCDQRSRSERGNFFFTKVK